MGGEKEGERQREREEKTERKRERGWEERKKGEVIEDVKENE